MSITIKNIKRIPADFFNQSTNTVAQQLLGMLVVRFIDNIPLIGKIVETESYTYNDPASHCYRKKTERTIALFGPVGHAYVYQIYGIHYGFNVVAHSKEDVAGGVLIRAIEPLHGIEYMRQHRNHVADVLLTNGPGKVTQALKIDKAFYGADLVQGQTLFIALPEVCTPAVIKATPRIGISKATDDLRRFIIADNQSVTPHRFNLMGS